MKIALDWLAEYLDRPVGAAEAETALTNAGLPLESVEPWGATQVLDVEVTSNRSDCLSYVGVARELGALLGRELRAPAAAPLENGPAAGSLTRVAIEDAAGCGYYSARVIEGVRVGPSPAWLIARLEASGLRAVNNIVDITNYVLMETGQPLHAFDLDTLRGRRIVVRRARAGEKIVAIDGKSYELQPARLVIADAERPVAVAGVMGGKETEVGAGTVNVLLEAARFDPVSIRATARALTLMSDASYRFERGIDPTAAERASRRAAALILQIAGGRLAQGVVTAGEAEAPEKNVTLRLARLKVVLGYEVPAARVVEILQALGFAPRHAGATVTCTVPSHRLDVEREIDLVEEVARVYGYGQIPLRNEVAHGVQPKPGEERAQEIVLRALQAAGFSETISVTFVDEAEAKLFLPAAQGTPIRVSDAVRKTSNVLRPSLLASLLAVRRTNQNAGLAEARVFEHAEGFWQEGDAAQRVPTQHRLLALVGSNVAEVKGALELVAERLNPAAQVRAVPEDHPWYAAGASASLVLEVGGRQVRLGTLGVFSAAVQKQYDLRHAAAGAEVFLTALLEAFEPVRRAKPLAKFPGMRRDLSVVVDEKVRWAEVAGAVAGAALAHLEKLDFVGTFRNQQVGTGKKSVTLALEFRDPGATLRAEQVDEQMKTVVGALEKGVGAVLR